MTRAAGVQSHKRCGALTALVQMRGACVFRSPGLGKLQPVTASLAEVRALGMLCRLLKGPVAHVDELPSLRVGQHRHCPEGVMPRLLENAAPPEAGNGTRKIVSSVRVRGKRF